MLQTLTKHPKVIAWFFIGLLYAQWLFTPLYGMANTTQRINYNPYYSIGSTGAPFNTIKKDGVHDNKVTQKKKHPVTGGPGQPEMQAFSSVNSNNMVDLFSGDFSYNIPLLDVGGYPVNLSYRGGISMDQEASWVGLGWNINPGTITRNMRGLPDEFDGKYDSVKKVMNIRENKTIGVTAGADVEIVGYPQNSSGSGTDTVSYGSIGGSLGVFHNNYKGWGMEFGINASINSGRMARGPLTGGLSMTDNSQEGLTLSPSLSVRLFQQENEDHSGATGNFSVSLPYNSRSGLKGLQLSTGVRQFGYDDQNQRHSYGSSFSTTISFASPSFTPSITMPLTNRQFSFTGKVGLEEKVHHPDFYLSGYVAKQRLQDRDTAAIMPSFGYLNYQLAALNTGALTDFNREKELPYRDNPPIPHIAVPSYTYDVFSITGEGTGGMFRAYRGDIGFVHDHFIRTRDESDRLSVDIGIADMVHAGVDLNVNRAFTQNGPWLQQNIMGNTIAFHKDSGVYQAAYFRNPGEKAINSKAFYDAIGGDDVVTVSLAQSGNSSDIRTTNYLTRYRNKRAAGNILLTRQNTVKSERDKRTQVISYLNALQADAAGLSKYIENYTVNKFSIASCNNLVSENPEGNGTGLPGLYYRNTKLSGIPYLRNDPAVNYDWGKGAPNPPIPILPPFTTGFPGDYFSIRWNGRVKAPVTGTYTFGTFSDDGVRLWINDSLLVNRWTVHGGTLDTFQLNLIAGEFYKIRMEYFDRTQHAIIKLLWRVPQQAMQPVPQIFLYPPPIDSFKINDFLVKEKRINSFRKENHISEIDVLNNDGKRYVYGIPVYNLRQKEATFAVNYQRENKQTGLAGYSHGIDNTAGNNRNGKDWYFSSEEMPAYAHSFLLTGILSPDYVDVTGNGISDDDLGDAVKFNYSKICGIANPYYWRVPYTDSATLNEGLKTDYRDDKGNYVYGEKELWYLHSIESKTMIATFTLENRDDLFPINEPGQKSANNSAQRLKEINLYSKADFLKKGTAAKPIKTVHFEYSYELCTGVNKPVNISGKLTLKKVWFTYNDNKKGQRNPYLFHYASNPNYNPRNYDRWGNYKDPLQNPGSTNTNLLGNDAYPYALQDSITAAQNAAAWTLDSIYLPSGGSMKIDFESDNYAYVQNKRALQLFNIIGFGYRPGMTANYSSFFYSGDFDNLYVYINVPQAVSGNRDVYVKYLQGLTKLYFKMSVKMPGDPYGSGYEYVPCYADLDLSGGYGMVNAHTIWVKMRGISWKGDGDGSFSPLAKAGIQFLRLNLPSKAYPGSEVGDNMDLGNAVKMLASLASNIHDAFVGFDAVARTNGWAASIDPTRSWIRLNNPVFKKYGGGHRVKRITIYDNWDKMTGQRAAMYGQEYTYTTQKEIDGVITTISSGVAAYEPGIGGEENPFHVPIEYTEQIAPLGPTTLGYSEEPLGESFFPAASVGYSKVRVRTLNYRNKKSANGYSESEFYTAYDFPVFTDRTMLNDDTKKRYKPSLANFLRINAAYHLVLSQGFKIELNDMHGKLKSEATYAETDPQHYISYTENIYRIANRDMDSKRLSNTVMAIQPDGTIDSSAVIGKDVELMVDMREQLSVTNAYNINLNTELFSIPFPTPPFFLIPSMLNLAQREENMYRSVATTKIIQRYGILDSVIHIDKGSKVSTKDLLYDSETGDVIINRTQNEFNDPVYNLNYPAHWVYDGMGLAYRNIDVMLSNIVIKDGRIVSGLSAAAANQLFSSGDEIMVAGRQKTGKGKSDCDYRYSTFPLYNKIWAIDSSVMNGGPKAFYFIDRSGQPYNGYIVSMKIIRSGRRNLLGSVGSVTSLQSPMVKNNTTGQYELVLNSNTGIVHATAGEFKQFWKVEDILKKGQAVSCDPGWQLTGEVRCLQQNGINTGFQEAKQIDANPNSQSYLDTQWVSLGLNCIECPKPAGWYTTGNIRCATDDNGNNTGYQEYEQLDTASCSASFNQTQWITSTLNCNACSKPANWQATGNTRCARDSADNNTGYLEREEKNMEECSNSYYTTRWVLTADSNCATCPKPANWQATGNTRCAKDSANNNTGYIESEQKDMESCSSSFNASRWVTTGFNCAACSKPANFQPTGNSWCIKDINGNNIGYLEWELKDMEPCSATYGTTRTTEAINCTACPKPENWQPTGNTRCAKDSANNNTGYQESEQRNMESCSSTYNNTRWVSTGTNCTTCPKPANWQPSGRLLCQTDANGNNTGYQLRREVDVEPCSSTYNSVRLVNIGLNLSACPTCSSSTCSGEDRKCVFGNCEVGIKVYTNSFYIGLGLYNCDYHYEWSDGSWSEDYSEFNTEPCGGFCACTDFSQKCINGQCETGIIICESSVYNHGIGGYFNTYYYEWSDGSQSDRWTGTSPFACLVIAPGP